MKEIKNECNISDYRKDSIAVNIYLAPADYNKIPICNRVLDSGARLKKVSVNSLEIIFWESDKLQ